MESLTLRALEDHLWASADLFRGLADVEVQRDYVLALHAREARMTLESLAEWEDIVREHVEDQERADHLGLPPAGAVALAVLRRADRGVDDGVLVETARGVADACDSVAGFRGWSERSDVVQGLRKAAVKELAEHPETRRFALEADIVSELLAGLATLDR